MKFADVVGQEVVKKRLMDSVRENRIPHAQLFSGPVGSGSLAIALAYAQFVLCLNRNEHDACGTCSSCLKVAKLIHPDFHFAFPVNTSKKISSNPVSDDYITEWREIVNESPYFTSNTWYNFIGLENKQGLINKLESQAIIKKLNLKSFESDYKIMLIWLPEKMNPTSSNMLLKLIEEPPKNTLFLLVSESPDDVLLTISSRCQPVRLGPIEKEVLALAVKEKFSLSDEAANEAGRLAMGNYIRAVEVIQSSEENEFNLEKFVNLMRLCYAGDFIQINKWIDEMHSIGRERLKSFFFYAVRMVRENFILNLKNSDLVYLSSGEQAFSQKFHPYINGRNVMEMSQELSLASRDIEANAYGKIVLFDMAIKIAKLIRK